MRKTTHSSDEPDKLSFAISTAADALSMFASEFPFRFETSLKDD